MALESRLINKIYLVKKQIGHGAFGEVYLGEDINKHKPVAIKTEGASKTSRRLRHESNIYRQLAGNVGIPTAYWSGNTPTNQVLVMDLLGHSLTDLLRLAPDGHFSLKTTLMLIDQMLSIVEIVHSRDIIHRDLKPDNFLMGTEENERQLFIIDFGLAKRYRDPDTHAHIPYIEGKQLTGTSRYASITTHLGVEQSRRDDLESLGYVFIYLVKGALPWQSGGGGRRKRHTSQEKHDAILECKMITSHKTLCADLPHEFVQYFEVVRALGFDEQPDYRALRGLFRAALAREGFAFDYVYDWTEVKTPTPHTPTRPVLPRHSPFFDDQEVTPERYLRGPDGGGNRSTKWNMLRRGVQSTTLPRSVLCKKPVVTRSPELRIKLLGAEKRRPLSPSNQ
jgi:serine/threonine protein kinase